jgi:hypothetical protein
LDAVGPKNAARIWGFISKFVMLDRFIKTLGVVEVHPGIPLPRATRLVGYLGSGAKVSLFLPNFLNPLKRLLDPRRA